MSSSIEEEEDEEEDEMDYALERSMRLQEEVIGLRSALEVERRNTAMHGANSKELADEVSRLQGQLVSLQSQFGKLHGQSAQRLDSIIDELVYPGAQQASDALEKERKASAKLRGKLEDHEVYRQVTDAALTRAKAEIDRLTVERDEAAREVKRLRRLDAKRTASATSAPTAAQPDASAKRTSSFKRASSSKRGAASPPRRVVHSDDEDDAPLTKPPPPPAPRSWVGHQKDYSGSNCSSTRRRRRESSPTKKGVSFADEPRVLTVDAKTFENLRVAASEKRDAETRALALEQSCSLTRARLESLELSRREQKRQLEALLVDVDAARLAAEKRAVELKREAEKYRELLEESLRELVARDTRISESQEGGGAIHRTAIKQLDEELSASRSELAEMKDELEASLAACEAEKSHAANLRRALGNSTTKTTFKPPPPPPPLR